MQTKRVICYKCKHYYVTWESNQPHGCKIYGFKSKLMPHIIVKRSSTKECQLFQIKSNK